MESNIRIEKYTPLLKPVWDNFVESSKNGTFLFKRDYMDYHADRFEDNSFIFYRKGKPYCLLPANLKDNILFSHQGLTYGGVIMNSDCTAEGILEVFDVLCKELSDEGVLSMVYKTVPHIYHKMPAEEDLYALFRHNAKLSVRNISSTINRNHPIPYNRNRKRNLLKAITNNIKIEKSGDWEELWPIVESNLKSRYNVAPTHNLEEMVRLAKKFPENIELFRVHKNSINVACGIFYITDMVVHAQYIHATSLGKELGAVDALVDHILSKEYKDVKYFDFGNSNEDNGRYLNDSLIHTKEGFGARAICYDTYEIKIL